MAEKSELDKEYLEQFLTLKERLKRAKEMEKPVAKPATAKEPEIKTAPGPSQLPTPEPKARSKYADLPESALKAMSIEDREEWDRLQEGLGSAASGKPALPEPTVRHQKQKPSTSAPAEGQSRATGLAEPEAMAAEAHSAMGMPQGGGGPGGGGADSGLIAVLNRIANSLDELNRKAGGGEGPAQGATPGGRSTRKWGESEPQDEEGFAGASPSVNASNRGGMNGAGGYGLGSKPGSDASGRFVRQQGALGEAGKFLTRPHNIMNAFRFLGGMLG